MAEGYTFLHLAHSATHGNIKCAPHHPDVGEATAMLDLRSLTQCAYDNCPSDKRLSTLIIDAEDGRLERRVCTRHLWAVVAITERLAGLAYRLVPYQR